MVALATTNEKIIYLAGIVDGEGCIRIRKGNRLPYPHYSPSIRIEMTDIIPIKQMSDVFGGNYYTYPPRKEHYKVVYQYDCHNTQRVNIILKSLLPYLQVKKQQAIEVLNFIEAKAKGPYDINIFEKMFLGVKRLNGSIV